MEGTRGRAQSPRELLGGAQQDPGALSAGGAHVLAGRFAPWVPTWGWKQWELEVGPLFPMANREGKDKNAKLLQQLQASRVAAPSEVWLGARAGCAAPPAPWSGWAEP